ELHSGGVARIRVPARCSAGRVSARGAQPAAAVRSDTRVKFTPSPETSSSNVSPHAGGGLIVATKVRCPCGGMTVGPIGPQRIVLPAGWQLTDPSFPVVPPTKASPGGATTWNARHAVEPELKNATSRLRPLAMYVPLPPSPAGTKSTATTAATRQFIRSGAGVEPTQRRVTPPDAF